jgi:hypothetical protein
MWFYGVSTIPLEDMIGIGDSRTCYVPLERNRDICYDDQKCAYFLPNQPHVSKIRTPEPLRTRNMCGWKCFCSGGCWWWWACMGTYILALVDRDVPARNLPPETGTQKNCSIPGPSRVHPNRRRQHQTDSL